MKRIVDGDKLLEWLVLSGYIDKCTCGEVARAFESASIFPENATNGEALKALFPLEETYVGEFGIDLGDIGTFDPDWWNAEYKGIK